MLVVWCFILGERYHAKCVHRSQDTFLYKEQSGSNVTSFKAPESLND